MKRQKVPICSLSRWGTRQLTNQATIAKSLKGRIRTHRVADRVVNHRTLGPDGLGRLDAKMDRLLEARLSKLP